MNRREFVQGAMKSSLAALLPLAGCRLGEAVSSSSAERMQPNIIFLLTDDQRWDSLGCINAMLRTPHIDALASDGVLFSNAFVTTSICCASRASILTGQYSRRHGIHNFSRQLRPQQLASTYPMLLKQAGYRIGFVGKYGVGGKNSMPSEQYDFWAAWPGQGKYEGHSDKDGKPIHLTQKLGNDSLEFLNGCVSGQPFCLSVSFKAPHAQDEDLRQYIYDPAYENVYENIIFPPPPRASHEDWQRMPEFFKRNNEGRIRWENRFSTAEKHQIMVRNYQRLIYGVDVQVGRIRDKLRQIGVQENTIIIFTSDNGYFLGEHGLADKWYPYEESIRVPLIIYDPRLPKNCRHRCLSEMALNIDLAPTLLSYADIPVPEVMQGRSLRPLIEGRPSSWRDDFFYEHLFDYEKIPKSEAVRGKRYKYICWITQDPVYEELFDLRTDPGETCNLAADPGSQEILISLRNRYRELRATAQ